MAKRGSVEWKQNISRGNVGRKSPKYWLGKKHTQEYKDKMSESLSGENNPMYGLKVPEERKRKIKSSVNKFYKTYGTNHLKVEKRNPPPPEERRRIAILGRKALDHRTGFTSIEKKVYDELRARGFLFETQKIINNKFVVDAYIPKLNLIIEADGDYWHSLPKTATKDKSENAYLKACGYDLVRWSEKDINFDVGSLVDTIKGGLTNV